ncbi:hypothetical protein [Pseudalkalibacillus caeni]|uniref:Uncharacterized protein n=1 Tax=Exobacillus caeni TaxID=2574798 RepID=A0A5R9F5M9_9BACL|nr:hypothetical protein [Pseudalkalibacillus caeni]TLS36123.1 hypothetical protein FCL54_17215 [Pseudalkalibacillus caeni]
MKGKFSEFGQWIVLAVIAFLYVKYGLPALFEKGERSYLEVAFIGFSSLFLFSFIWILFQKKADGDESEQKEQTTTGS